MALAFRVLLQYLELNDIYSLKNFLDSNSFQVDDKDDNGATILMHAATRGTTAAAFVKELVLRGADIQAEDYDNWTALLYATKGGHYEIVQYLLDHGANIEHREMGGWSPLMWASYKGHIQIVNLLLERGADVHCHGNYHLSPLLWAAGRGHYEVVVSLINKGAKVNSADKYGTTALIWACRKGSTNIVDFLVKSGANVDTAGMYSWTPLLVAVSGGHMECVSLLLEKRPNVNALDKEGMTALAIACREGLYEIVTALISSGSYINIQDRSGDTPLIHAVKGGHRTVVEVLLKKHADIDIQGKDKKSALYYAVEKQNVQIVKTLLSQNPDLELETKDCDTALLRAVKIRNLDIASLLLEKRAKVGATDKKGDNSLHIAMRARSKAIVELLLRNPKNSQLLYRANKAGETPYGLDNLHQKTILSQVFGARSLNTSEDPEGILGYDLYSSALADILSEPTLSTPITIGLYAKWGSGKSFLLKNVRDEMRTFASQWTDPSAQISFILFITVVHVALFFATITGMCTWSATYAVINFAAIITTIYIFLIIMRMIYTRYQSDWIRVMHCGMSKQLQKLRLILQVAFCYPPNTSSDIHNLPVKFLFSEINNTPPHQQAIGLMIASLLDKLESHYGVISTRLYRALRPKHVEQSRSWRRTCCVPIVLLFEMTMLLFGLEICLLVIYYVRDDLNEDTRNAVLIAMYVVAAMLVAAVVANFHILARLANSLFVPPASRIKRQTRSGNDGLSSTALESEVRLLSDMIKCLDAFVGQQSRLVGVIDVLDCMDIEKVLNILSVIQTLVSTPSRPFIILIAVDPHIITKAAEARSKRLLTEVGSIGGHDFLRNLVHLPVYLQSSNWKKIHKAQQAAIYALNRLNEPERRLSNASELGMSTERLRSLGASRTGSKKNRMQPDSLASSIASNIHKLGHTTSIMQPMERSRLLFTEDFFSDVNPKSMKRLINVVSLTVRLLKAFQIQFNWQRLSSWINLTEQWPLRATLIVLEFEKEDFDEQVSLLSIYEKGKSKIPYLKESASFLEMDRDERKLESFLNLHKSDLTVSDLKIFLPFTFNLDPYLKKVLKEDQQAFEEEFEPILPPEKAPKSPKVSVAQNKVNFPFNSVTPGYPQLPLPYGLPPQVPYGLPSSNLFSGYMNVSHIKTDKRDERQELISEKDLQNVALTRMSVAEIVKLLKKIPDLQPTISVLATALQENAITGRVLMNCDLGELKSVLKLNFGYWEILKLVVSSLRAREFTRISTSGQVEGHAEQRESTDHPPKKHSTVSRFDKQVTIEEEMINETLQLLNSDALENKSDEEPDIQINIDEAVLTPIRESSEIGSPKRRELVRSFTIGDFEESNDPIQTVILMPQFSIGSQSQLSINNDESSIGEPKLK